MKFPWLIDASLILGVGLLCACDNSQSRVAREHVTRAQSQPDAMAKAGRPVAERRVVPRTSAITYQALFTRALTKGPWGEEPVVVETLPSQGGLECTPRAITSRNPEFSITLPEKVEDRRHDLVAITAGGSILTIYQPYDSSEVETEDVLPINAELSWSLAKIQRSFDLSAFVFDGLYKDDVRPSGVFLNEGVYIVALVNSADAELLRANGDKPTVYAACSIHWTP